jgi:hypothetical protein
MQKQFDQDEHEVTELLFYSLTQHYLKTHNYDALKQLNEGERKQNVLSEIIPQWIHIASDNAGEYFVTEEVHAILKAKMLEDFSNPDFKWIIQDYHGFQANRYLFHVQEYMKTPDSIYYFLPSGKIEREREA